MAAVRIWFYCQRRQTETPLLHSLLRSLYPLVVASSKDVFFLPSLALWVVGIDWFQYSTCFSGYAGVGSLRASKTHTEFRLFKVDRVSVFLSSLFLLEFLGAGGVKCKDDGLFGWRKDKWQLVACAVGSSLKTWYYFSFLKEKVYFWIKHSSSLKCNIKIKINRRII